MTVPQPIVRDRERPQKPDPFEGRTWAVSASVLAYGVRVNVRLSDLRFADALLRYLPPGSEVLPVTSAARTYSIVVEHEPASDTPCGSLFVNGSAIARRSAMPALFKAFENNFHLHVAEMAPDRVFVHAAVIGWKGRAILLPGRSFSGKTTLATALMEAGGEYYSDEYAVLDAAGLVHPYPRPPAIRQAAHSTAPAEFTGSIGTVPLPVGLVVHTRYRPGGTWQPRRLSPGQGGLALLSNTVSARRNPKTALATLERVLATAPVFATDRAEALSVVESILELATVNEADHQSANRE